MQYILDETEYAEYQKALKQLKKLPSISTLQITCTKIANTLPIKYWSNTEAEPWGCILTEDNWHCDECPVQDICPADKSWSK
jgi:hypothetical protein